MRTAIIIAIGFVVLAVFFVGPRLLGRFDLVAAALKLYLVVWLIAALVNGWLGVRAGYTWAQELPISLVIFLVPGAVAAYILWKYG